MKHALLSSLLMAALLVGAVPAQAQRPLLSTEVAADTARQNYGPHRRHFRHLYGGWLPVLGQPAHPGAELRSWASSEVQLGLREKLQLTPLFAIGADVRYVRLQYALRQNEAKVLPTATLHKSESLVLHRLDLEGWARLRFDRRGNTVGRYLDLSGWGGWVAGTAHHTDDEPAGGTARRQKTTETGLAYCRRWQYGVGARLGSQRFALSGRYRLSDTFRGPLAATYPEPPRWVLGLEIGLL
ncbi:hypothetical protein [Hymenobacter sp. CRA2]|uniref:hypothetical protein n=1 Tax=Hymenobacter sp. CRA2 TaxID=1955620 RepID=UPI00098FA624|nr:hypothetical protein [Hymenobacter sp. CRA2]OON70056.1 hypothetical protein B0919_04735 [Hymenobacter sp. CRA2]